MFTKRKKGCVVRTVRSGALKEVAVNQSTRQIMFIKVPGLFMFVLSLLALLSCAQASMLSDAALFFDPDSIAPDFYPQIDFPDLALTNNYVFNVNGNPVIDVDILPVLKPGSYPSGYLFTQNDYDAVPNVDYLADLTNGTLTTTFYEPGLYHVRVTRQTGSEIFAIFAETALEKKDGASDKTGANKKVEPPQADLWVIDKSADKPQEATQRETILTNAGQTTTKVTSRQEAIDAIKARSEELGRKIHVEFAGHGTNGNASTGAGEKNIADKQIDASSVADFQKEIDDYVNNITFWGMCSVGKGQDGKDFLKVLADSIGTASGWDSPIMRVDSTHYTVEHGATYVTIPEPVTVLMLEPWVNDDDVHTGDGGVELLRILWSEPVIFDGNDVSIKGEDNVDVPFSISGSNSQFMIIAFGQTLLNDEYTITISDSVQSEETGFVIDGDNDGLPGGDAVLIMEHRQRHDSDNNNDVGLSDFAAFAEKWLWHK